MKRVISAFSPSWIHPSKHKTFLYQSILTSHIWKTYDSCQRVWGSPCLLPLYEQRGDDLYLFSAIPQLRTFLHKRPIAHLRKIAHDSSDMLGKAGLGPPYRIAWLRDWPHSFAWFRENYFVSAWLRESTCVRDAWKRQKTCVISWNHSKTCVNS